MNYKRIFNQNEGKTRKIDNRIFKAFIKEYSKKSRFDVHSFISNKGLSSQSYEKIFWELHSYILNHATEDILVFYSLLEEFNYNMKHNLISFIRLSGEWTFNILPDDISKFLSKVPIVNSITCSAGEITIYSKKLGTYSFCSITKYFEHNSVVSHFLDIADLDFSGECHKASWLLIQFLEHASLVTTLVPGYFNGAYYHTVIKHEDNMIIDAANETVYDLDTFNRLTEGTVVCETKQEEMYEKLAEVNRNTGYAKALVLALHCQANL